MKANKGEWSEIYVFLKLLSEGKIYAADENLNKINDVFYSLIKIIRNENDNTFEYFYGTNINIYNTKNKLLLSMPINEFRKKSIQVI